MTVRTPTLKQECYTRQTSVRSLVYSQPLLEVIHHKQKPFPQLHLGLPPQHRFSLCDIRLALFGVICSIFTILNNAIRVNELLYQVGQLNNLKFVGVACVEGADLGAIHNANHGLYKVSHVLEATGLGAIALCIGRMKGVLVADIIWVKKYLIALIEGIISVVVD